MMGLGLKGGFWLLFCAYFVVAFSRSILMAALNDYFASCFKQSLGYAFGLMSLGAFASPLVCQTIIAMGIPWPHFYLGSLVLSAFNVALPSVDVPANYNGVLKRPRKCDEQANKKPRRIYGSHATYKQVRVGRGARRDE